MRFIARLGFSALALPFVFGLTGCGLITSDDPTVVPDTRVRDGDPNVTNPKPTDIGEPPIVGLDLEGSFDLRFSAVVVSPKPGNEPFPGGDSPSESATLRLDIAADGNASGYRAVVTPRWGRPAVVDLIKGQDGKSLVLMGDVVVYLGSTSNHWATITLGLNAAGKLSGEISASGERMIFMGDAGYTQSITGKGTLSADVTAPEVRTKLVSRIGPMDALLPWDELVVEAAEPLDANRLVQETVFQTSSGSLAVDWDAPSSEESQSIWAGTTRRVARAKSWPIAATGWESATSAPLVDRVGLSTGTGKLESFQFLALPGPTSALGFDDDIMQASFWGNLELLGGGFVGLPDSRCEAGGCAKMNFPYAAGCTPPRAGLAGRLVRSGQIKVRYRFFAANSSLPNSGAPYLFGTPLIIDAATEGGDVTTHYVSPASSDLVHLAAPIDGYEWATPWTTGTFNVPSGTGPVGFAVSVSNPTACIGGGPVPMLDVMVLVESVTN